MKPGRQAGGPHLYSSFQQEGSGSLCPGAPNFSQKQRFHRCCAPATSLQQDHTTAMSLMAELMLERRLNDSCGPLLMLPCSSPYAHLQARFTDARRHRSCASRPCAACSSRSSGSWFQSTLCAGRGLGSGNRGCTMICWHEFVCSTSAIIHNCACCVWMLSITHQITQTQFQPKSPRMPSVNSNPKGQRWRLQEAFTKSACLSQADRGLNVQMDQLHLGFVL